MHRPKSNIQMYCQVAMKLGLSYEFVQSTPTRSPLLISNGDRFCIINTKSPGFYPETRRWNAHFTQSKLLTQKILNRFGYTVIDTEAIRISGFNSAEELYEYLSANHQNLPILIKPDRSYDSNGISIIDSLSQYQEIAQTHFREQTDFLLQPIFEQTEYRILVVHGEVMLMHSKQNLHVTGDGKSTIDQLLANISPSKKDDVYIKWQHSKQGTSSESVLESGERFDYHLTKIPTDSFYLTKDFPQEVIDWSVKLAHTISSPVVGIDVFIPGDITDTNSYTIIELNSNPAVYYLPTRCNDNITSYQIIEKILTDFFKS